MSQVTGDIRSTLTLNATKSSGDETSDDLCSCGHAICSAKTRRVSNPLELLCTICVAARDASNRENAKMAQQVEDVSGDSVSPNADGSKCQSRKRLTRGQKLEMIELLESKVQVREIAQRFSCGERTVYRVMEKANDLRKEANSPAYDGAKKSIRSGLYPEVEEGVAALVKGTREHGLPVTQATVTAYAETTKHHLLSRKDVSAERKRRITEFCASHNWAKNFIRRSKLESIGIYREIGSVDHNAIEEVMDEVKTACGKYRLENIFNVDETGLFFKILPRRTYFMASKSRKTVRGTKDMAAKDRLTLYVCTNATGSAKVPMSIVGRSQNPRCFEGKRVPLKYFSQGNAWSDGKTFRTWFDEVFVPFARHHTRGTEEKVLLLMNCCRSHDSLSDPKGRVQVMMYPPNCTNIHQPVNMGIIASTKLHYRKRLLRRRTELLPMSKALRAAARERKLPAGTKGLMEGHKPHLLDAAQLICLAWADVTETIISRCWARALTLPCHHQAVLTGGPTKPRCPEQGMLQEVGMLSAAVEDLSNMLLAMGDVGTDQTDQIDQKDPCVTELLGALRELGIEPGGSPDQEAVDAIAAWAVIEDREDIAEALRSDMEAIILRDSRQTSVEESEDSDHEDTAKCTHTFEEKVQSLRIVEELAVDVGDDECLRHLRQLRDSLTKRRSNDAIQESEGDEILLGNSYDSINT